MLLVLITQHNGRHCALSTGQPATSLSRPNHTVFFWVAASVDLVFVLLTVYSDIYATIRGKESVSAPLTKVVRLLDSPAPAIAIFDLSLNYPVRGFSAPSNIFFLHFFWRRKSAMNDIAAVVAALRERAWSPAIATTSRPSAGAARWRGYIRLLTELYLCYLLACRPLVTRDNVIFGPSAARRWASGHSYNLAALRWQANSNLITPRFEG